MSREDSHFRLRLPDELKERVRFAASESGRSMTAEIVFRLEQSFALTALETDDAIRDLTARLEAVERELERLADRPQLD